MYIPNIITIKPSKSQGIYMDNIVRPTLLLWNVEDYSNQHGDQDLQLKRQNYSEKENKTISLQSFGQQMKGQGMQC